MAKVVITTIPASAHLIFSADLHTQTLTLTPKMSVMTMKYLQKSVKVDFMEMQL